MMEKKIASLGLELVLRAARGRKTVVAQRSVGLGLRSMKGLPISCCFSFSSESFALSSFPASLADF